MSLVRDLWHRLWRGGRPPTWFTGTLDEQEQVVAAAAVRGGGYVLVTTWGLWLCPTPLRDPMAAPTSASTPEARRIGWHLVSKASWSGAELTVIEGEVRDRVGDAVLLADRAPVRVTLVYLGRVPWSVRARVEGSISSRHRRELPGGAAWFVQRRVPGEDGVVLQVWADQGTDEASVRHVAAEVALRLRQAHRAAR